MRQLMMGCIAASAAGFGLTDYTYTGNSLWVPDTLTSWRLKFLTSGVFTPKKSVVIDMFLLGGGGGGRTSNSGTGFSGAGGAGGRTATVSSVTLVADQPYTITVGAGGVSNTAGGWTSFLPNDYSIPGGTNSSDYRYGGNGGSGGGGGNSGYGAQGHGGSNGSAGTASDFAAGTGQGTNTYEFGDNTMTLYAGGGGSGAGQYGGSTYNGGTGGAGGGANGGIRQGGAGASASANTGGGGGGGGGKSGVTGLGGIGGSGILVIRNKRG